MAEIHKAQRIGVFVDVQNLYYSAKYVYRAHVNYQAILKDAVANRTLVRARAYVIRAEETAHKSFYDALANIGFEVKAKDLQIFPGGSKKGDWDVGIAMDAIQQAPKIDTVVLISGDGDYIPLVEHLQKAMGCRVEVVAFGKSTSGKLIEAADSFLDLDKRSARYLMKERSKTRSKRSVKKEG